AELESFDWNGQHFCYPMNSYWFNDPVRGTAASASICNIAYPAGYGFPYSDERHWDNMGFEVFPATEAPASNFSSFASIVQPPPRTPVQYVNGSVPTAPTNLRIVGLLLDALFSRAGAVPARLSPALQPADAHAHMHPASRP